MVDEAAIELKSLERACYNNRKNDIVVYGSILSMHKILFSKYGKTETTQNTEASAQRTQNWILTLE